MFAKGLIKNEAGVYLKHDTHQYFDKHGDEYASWSKFFKSFEEEFDTEGISYRSALKSLREKGIVTPTEDQVIQEQNLFKAKWSKAGVDGAGTGTEIHDSLELFCKTGQRSMPSLNKVYDELYMNYIKPSYKYYNEQVLSLPSERLAGTADLICFRKNSSTTSVDIFDFKTNINKGIETSSKYGKFFFNSISHLEDCNYNKYALQLSMYAYFLQQTEGYRIGRLAILFVRDGYIREYPVPYQQYQIRDMIMDFNMLKQKPVENSNSEFVNDFQI